MVKRILQIDTLDVGAYQYLTAVMNYTEMEAKVPPQVLVSNSLVNHLEQGPRGHEQ